MAGPRFSAEQVDARRSRVSELYLQGWNQQRIANEVGVSRQQVGLDIRHATVQTIGMEVVDTFYVRTWTGDLVVDPQHRKEIERAVLHAVH